MERSVTEFIWQMIILILFIGALSLFFLVNTSIRDTMSLVDSHISQDRNMTDASSEVSGAVMSDRVLGGSIILQISEGLEVPIVVDGFYYGLDSMVELSAIEETATYRRSYAIDTEGKLYEIRYTKMP